MSIPSPLEVLAGTAPLKYIEKKLVAKLDYQFLASIQPRLANDAYFLVCMVEAWHELDWTTKETMGYSETIDAFLVLAYELYDTVDISEAVFRDKLTYMTTHPTNHEMAQ